MERARLKYALVVSAALHLLVVWIVANHIELSPDSPPRAPKPIYITLEQSQAVDTPPTEPSIAPKEAQQPPLQTQSDPPKKLSAARPKMPAPIDEKVRRTKEDGAPSAITAAKIISSASDIARGMAMENPDKDTGERKNEKLSVSAILDRALNSPREAAGVATLSDGTIRVVTEQGLTYCIKPLDDWRILGPEDDMRVSVSCK